MSLAWAGCSIEKHYDLLSFFFDGVPNPNALPVAATSGSVVAMRESPTYVIHEPYADRKCNACHKARFTRAGVTSDVCLECHDAVRDEHRFMHGPVVLGACLWCHVAHESAFAHLLKDQSRPVCMQCHAASMLSTDRVPAHADEARSCLECHRGHGGETRLMLREMISESGEAGG